MLKPRLTSPEMFTSTFQYGKLVLLFASIVDGENIGFGRILPGDLDEQDPDLGWWKHPEAHGYKRVNLIVKDPKQENRVFEEIQEITKQFNSRIGDMDYNRYRAMTYIRKEDDGLVMYIGMHSALGGAYGDFFCGKTDYS